MKQVTRFFILFCGFLETFIFTGNIFGWTALHHLLVEIGVYQHLCEEEFIVDGSKNVTISGTPNICDAQDTLLNLAFTIGSFCLGATAFAWGFLLDRWGIRVVRLVINVLLTSGTLLLSFTGRSRSYLVFPSLVLMCLAGVPLRLANMQVADLFPQQRSTVITMYSGAFGESAAIFVFIKYGFDRGLPWEWACSILVILSLLMLPVTLFLMPSSNFREPKEKGMFSAKSCHHEVAGITPSVWGTYILVKDPFDVSNNKTNGSLKQVWGQGKDQNGKPEKDVASKIEKNNSGPVALKESVFSLSYLLHQYWFCWLLLYTILFVGTLHLWSEVALNDPEEGEFFAQLYSLLQVAGLILAPLGGLFMDWSIRKASKVKDPEQRRLSELQSNFWPLIVTSAIAVVAQVAQFYNSSTAIWISIVCVTVFRTFLLSIGTAYLRIRFPAEHFNRLMGIISTMSALFTLLQFPLFLWMSSSVPKSMIQVNIFNTICLILACVHPFLILVTPLQRYLIRKEEKTKE